MPLYTDQTGREVDVPYTPRRIVSLVPSQTELLHHLHLEKEVAGITKFCTHPPHWFQNKKRIGGTKTVHLEAVKALQPDLILANKEENIREQVENLAADFPVWISDVANLEQALQMIAAVGQLTGKEAPAQELLANIRRGFDELSLFTKERHFPSKAAYLIWKEPYMAAGGDTFIHDLLQRAGLHNIFADKNRYPQTTVDELQQQGCNLLLLSSEPYPFEQKHKTELQPLLPHTNIVLTDGTIFSWYGSRLLQAPAYIRQILWPQMQNEQTT